MIKQLTVENSSFTCKHILILHSVKTLLSHDGGHCIIRADAERWAVPAEAIRADQSEHKKFFHEG